MPPSGLGMVAEHRASSMLFPRIVSIKPRREFNYPRHRNEEALIYRRVNEMHGIIRLPAEASYERACVVN